MGEIREGGKKQRKKGTSRVPQIFSICMQAAAIPHMVGSGLNLTSQDNYSDNQLWQV